jgi:hypothetical protein
MRKISEKLQKQNWDAVEKLLDARDTMAMEVMQKVFELLPYGQKFTLSDGSVGYLRKFEEPELCPDENSDYFQCPKFGLDVVIEGGKLDHIEISAFQTGSGMAIGLTHAEVQNAGANSPATDKADVAPTSDDSAKWTASHGRGIGRQSASSPGGARRGRGNSGGSRQR